MNAWRDVDSDSARIRLVIRGRGLCLYVGKRLYRAYWGRS